MTKDRRLGRGLAALLGSPLEEETTVQIAASGPVPKTTPPAARQAVTGPIPLSSLSPTGPVPASPVTANPSDRPQSPDSQTAAVKPTGASSGETRQSLQLSVYEIENNPFQPRRKFNEEEIASLAASIREHEQLQPILVRRVGERYQLISGERRLRAAIHAGLKTIRAEVREADDRLVAELAIVENLQRKDLDAIEKALSFRRYIDQHECSQEQLAKRLKIDRSTVTNMMRLLELPQEIQQWIQAEKITVGHAKALLSLGEEQQQIDFGRQIQEEGWSVRETERRVSARLESEDAQESSSGNSANRSTQKRTSPHIASLEQQLRLFLGTKTQIKQTSTGSGKITISFANNAEFERLCGILCPEMAKQRAA